MATNTKTNKVKSLFNRQVNTRILFLLLFYAIIGIVVVWGLVQLFMK